MSSELRSEHIHALPVSKGNGQHRVAQPPLAEQETRGYWAVQANGGHPTRLTDGAERVVASPPRPRALRLAIHKNLLNVHHTKQRDPHDPAQPGLERIVGITPPYGSPTRQLLPPRYTVM